MQNTNRKIEEFIDEKLRGSRVTKTSGDFGVHLMKRIAEEHKSAKEESKWDRLVKYIIGSFGFLLIGFTVTLGLISGTSSDVKSPSTGINFSPAVETSNNYLERFLGFIESVFMGVLNFFGLSSNTRTFTVILLVAAVVGVFLLAERFVLKSRLRSSNAAVK